MRQRSRELRNPDILPSMCTVDLMEKESCEGKCMGETPRKTGRDKLANNFEVRHTYEIDLNDPCAVTPWSDWSPCTATLCGRGVRERWRMFLRKSAQQMNCGYEIMERNICYGAIPDCRKAFMMKNFTGMIKMTLSLLIKINYLFYHNIYSTANYDVFMFPIMMHLETRSSLII